MPRGPNNSKKQLQNNHAIGGWRTKDILGEPKGWGPKKKVANIEIYVIFEVFAFCGGRTKTDFKDRGPSCKIKITNPTVEYSPLQVLHLPGANLPPGGWDGLGEMEVRAS